MKWVMTWLLGVLCGSVVAASLIYFNPMLTANSDAFAGTASLRYELGPDTLSFTQGGVLDAYATPVGAPQLWESTIADTAFAMFAMRDRAGRAVAIASRLSRLSGLTNPVTGGVIVADAWLVTVPGAGSYFIDAQENVWPLLRDTLVDVGLLRRSWSGARRYATTIGPDTSDAAVVTGATGRFVGIGGRAANAYEVDRFSGLRDIGEPVRGELSLDIARSAADVTADSETP
jgi:hypothetical protein